MKNKFKYLSILLCSSSLISCADKVINKGEWLVVSNSTASVLTSTNIPVVPFNTVMTFKYFKNEKKTYDFGVDHRHVGRLGSRRIFGILHRRRNC